LARRPKNNNQQNIAHINQSIFISPDEHLDISMLETWSWDAACAIRGSTDAPKFKDFIFKRNTPQLAARVRRRRFTPP
jgi:type I restriction enzyme M protein